MLREIRCAKFRSGAVQFGPSLNVVLGDDNATNSIGKSTLLMVIDFAFGGDTLTTHNRDVVTALGDHDYYFAFAFDGETLSFRRGTAHPNIVYVCDDEDVAVREIALDEYTAILKQAYNSAFVRWSGSISAFGARPISWLIDRLTSCLHSGLGSV